MMVVRKIRRVVLIPAVLITNNKEGFGSSTTGLVLQQFKDSKFEILLAEQYEHASITDMVSRYSGTGKGHYNPDYMQESNP